jgi:protein gp37
MQHLAFLFIREDRVVAGLSKIEWTEQTWNPVVGCSIVSPGCTNCYAMKMASRIEAMGTQPRYAGTTRKVNGKAIWTGKIARAPESTFHAPMHRRKPTRYFVNSMSDLFHEDVPDQWIDDVISVMARSPWHTFQVLTKRSERMLDYMRAVDAEKFLDFWSSHVVYAEGVPGFPARLPQWPLPNLWLGVSTERQKEADERIPHLLATPAAVRFISAEPLLGPLDISRYITGWDGRGGLLEYLDWVIVGGESGSGARPMHPGWARDLRDQCEAADVAYFFKQFGNWAPHQFASNNSLKGEIRIWPDGHVGTGNANEHGGSGCEMDMVGKKIAGRLLDGIEHNGMPRGAS